MNEYFPLGAKAKLYFGDAGAALSNLTELDNVKDVTVNMDKGSADTTTRANQGFRSETPTLKEVQIECEIQFKINDAAYTALRDAWLNDTPLRLAALTGDRTESGSEGPMGDFGIKTFNRSEPLEDTIKVSVTATLMVWDSWVVV